MIQAERTCRPRLRTPHRSADWRSRTSDRLGFPLSHSHVTRETLARESLFAAQSIAKYAGFVVLDKFSPELLYGLLVLRENIYTDPQKPIQVTPGLYEINAPKTDSPVLVTTNFSITYFSVANEVESSGLPGTAPGRGRRWHVSPDRLGGW